MVKGRHAHKVQLCQTYRHTYRIFLTELAYVGLTLLAQLYLRLHFFPGAHNPTISLFAIILAECSPY